MSDFVDVRVKWNGSGPVCEPDPIRTWWKQKGATAARPNVRWIFDGSLPADVTGARITWEEGKKADGYLPFPLGCSFGCEPAEEGERLPRLTVADNLKLAGRYKYTVTLMRAGGAPPYAVDPEAENEPNPPEPGP